MTESSRSFDVGKERDLDGSAARDLVAGLKCLHDLESTVARLIACGQRAIEPLTEFLLEGRPSCIYQPRQRAVEALGGLGAKTVLMEYLRLPQDIPDPVVRFGEEAVKSAAARELAVWRTEEVFQLLLSVASERRLSGVIEALGVFRRAEAVPYFEKALEDDVCRPAAEEALRKLGAVARAALVRSSLSPFPSLEQEVPSSLCRRRSALRLLAEVGVTKDDWSLLRPFLDQEDPDLVAAASRLALTAGDREDRIKAVQRLLEVLASANWYLQEEIEDYLVALCRESSSVFGDEIGSLTSQADEQHVSDRVRRTVLRIRKHLEGTK